MTFTPIDPVTTTLFGATCFTAGGAFAVFIATITLRKQAAPPSVADIASALDDNLRAQARLWAVGRGTPGMAGWAHHRLRTLIAARQKPSQATVKKSWRWRP